MVVVALPAAVYERADVSSVSVHQRLRRPNFQRLCGSAVHQCPPLSILLAVTLAVKTRQGRNGFNHEVLNRRLVLTIVLL